MRELSLLVVGLDFPNPDRSRSNRRFEAALCRPGDPVELRPEPRNLADPHAVAVFSERGVQLGYVTAERAPLVRRRLAAGTARAVFQELGPRAAVVRARFDGAAPTLPPKRAVAAADEEAFAPDPDGPDWGA